MGAEFFPAGVNAKWDEPGGRILLGDKRNRDGYAEADQVPVCWSVHCNRTQLHTYYSGANLYRIPTCARHSDGTSNYCQLSLKCPYWIIRAGQWCLVRKRQEQLFWLKTSVIFLGKSRKIPGYYTDLVTTTSSRILIHHQSSLHRRSMVTDTDSIVK